MRNFFPGKRARIRAAPKQYAKLRKEILVRDGWCCQKCGRSTNLDVHHIRWRSDLGDDTEAYLITLCRECHRVLHGASSKRLVRSGPQSAGTFCKTKSYL